MHINRKKCLAELDGSNLRPRPSYFQGAGRLVQQGKGHHVGGGEVHFSQCTWLNPKLNPIETF